MEKRVNDIIDMQKELTEQVEMLQRSVADFAKATTEEEADQKDANQKPK